MPETVNKRNKKPLTEKEIKHVLLDREVTIADLARLATADMGREVTHWQMSAVIHRYPNIVYQELREWLARWIGCEAWRVGNEPRRASEEEEADAA